MNPNPYEQPEAPTCRTCKETMQERHWGRGMFSGTEWICVNPECEDCDPKTKEETDDACPNCGGSGHTNYLDISVPIIDGAGVKSVRWTAAIFAWIIPSSDGLMDILVPQCCHEWANIVIAYSDKYKRHQFKSGAVMRRVNLPSFEIEKNTASFGEMDFAIYEKYLTENKTEIIALIERLNAVQ